MGSCIAGVDPSLRPSRRSAEVKVMVDEFSQAQVPGEGGRQEQAGIGRQAMVVKEDADTVGFVLWQQKLWSGANLQERRKLLMTMLDAVYVDSSENTIVAIKPKAPFKPVFGVVTTRDGSEVVLVHDLDARPRTADQPPPNGTVAPDGLEADDDPCLWWRRGRAYLHLEHELRLAGLEIDGGVGIVGSAGRGQGRHSRLPLRQVVRIGVPSVEGRQLRRHFDALRRMRV